MRHFDPYADKEMIRYSSIDLSTGFHTKPMLASGLVDQCSSTIRMIYDCFNKGLPK